MRRRYKLKKYSNTIPSLNRVHQNKYLLRHLCPKLKISRNVFLGFSTENCLKFWVKSFITFCAQWWGPRSSFQI